LHFELTQTEDGGHGGDVDGRGGPVHGAHLWVREVKIQAEKDKTKSFTQLPGSI
jgi:hypothetical protein